jgi:glutathione peroxidase
MAIYDVEVARLDGSSPDLNHFEGKAVLVDNLASKCGLTPQYTGLERLQQRFADRAHRARGALRSVRRPGAGAPEEIVTFCSATYGVTFPMAEKVEVNGDGRYDLYRQLTAAPDADGKACDIQWNFEKSLVSPDGEVVSRFRPMTDPESDEVTAAIEAVLPG